MTEFEEGYFLGLLVGEGHFGGDGIQPQVTVKMHIRHTELFHWLATHIPDSKLYGPYHHGGRVYYQWMARGRVLREEVLPFLRRHLKDVDSHIRERINRMIERYELDQEVYRKGRRAD